MKLIEKTSIYYLVYTLFIFAIGTILFYFLIKEVLVDGIDEALHQEKMQIIDNLKYELNFEDLKPSENVEIHLSKLKEQVADEYRTITVVLESEDPVHFRQLSSVYLHDGKYYEIIIKQSLAEAESLIKNILPIEIVLFLILMAGVLLINRHVSKKIWRPFYELLDKLRNYHPIKTGVIPSISTDIDEFDALGDSISKMTEKINQDYMNQKEFNENSSHELQTPLAIIRNKLELLIQSKNLEEKEMLLIEGVFEAVRRLNNLNKGLILLAKIDNQQFESSELINVKEVLEKVFTSFEEQINSKNISVEKRFTGNAFVSTNLILFEILLNNLISNAIKHNIQNGEIVVELEENSLKIINSGRRLEDSSEKMFQRFKKQSNAENSIGLGLSIVKKICDLFNFDIQYNNVYEKHTITLTF